MPSKELRRKARGMRECELSGAASSLKCVKSGNPVRNSETLLFFYLKCCKDIIPFAHS